jgi:sulfide:quinone oxidoreductase
LPTVAPDGRLKHPERRKGGVVDRNGKTRVLIAGGGVAALEAALALRDLAEGRVRVELLAPEPQFWYRPLAVAAPFKLGEVLHLELDGLARGIGASFTPGALVGVDAWRHIAHTSKNTQIEYDVLLIACGALAIPAIPGALTFRGPADIEMIEHLLEEIAGGGVRSVAFAIPWGAVWMLPGYELALLTAAHLEQRAVRGIELTVVTPEQEPLQVFGPPASDAMRELLAERSVGLRAGVYPGQFVDRELRLIPEGAVAADRVVALPRLKGAPIDGIPQTVDGFVPVDAHCHVHGIDDVYAVGDITSFTVKQGGIAAQQADAAAEAIAAAAGADVLPKRFHPVLRGLLLTGGEPRYLRREIRADPEREPLESYEPLWWPPAKIVGRYLAPFLASIAENEAPPVEVELDPEAAQIGLQLEREDGAEGERVEDFMSPNPLIVAPEDTLAEVAERMVVRDGAAVAVAEYGRLIGILTRTDLLRAYAARAHPSEARVRQWMTAEPLTIFPGTALSAAATLMREYGINHLPVVEGERPVGLVSMRDVLRSGAAFGTGVGLGF